MYDVLIIGAGPGGIFSAYELMERKPDLKIAVFEVGHPLEHRKCPLMVIKSSPVFTANAAPS